MLKFYHVSVIIYIMLASVKKVIKSEKSNLLHSIYVNTSLSRNDTEKREAIQRLIDESQPNTDYFVLLVLSALITTMGLLASSTAIVIGGMLITPMLSSVLALGLGFVTVNPKSLIRSAWAVLRSIVYVMFLAFVTAKILGVDDLQNVEILQRTVPSRLYVHVALLSGMAATYTWAKPKLSSSLPGVAIAVALLPPLCVAGIGLASQNIKIAAGAFDMFLVNLFGIIISAVFIFTLLGFQRMKKIETKEIENKEKQEEKEKQKASVAAPAV